MYCSCYNSHISVAYGVCLLHLMLSVVGNPWQLEGNRWG